MISKYAVGKKLKEGNKLKIEVNLKFTLVENNNILF